MQISRKFILLANLNYRIRIASPYFVGVKIKS